MARKSKKVLAAVLTISMISQVLFGESGAGTVHADTSKDAGNQQQTEESFSIERLTSNYTIVSSGYTAPAYKGDPVLWQMDKILYEGDSGYLAGDNYGYENGVVDVKSGDSIRDSAGDSLLLGGL